MNPWDVVVLALIAAAVLLAVRGMRRDAKRGCSGCCATCLQAGRCGRQGTPGTLARPGADVAQEGSVQGAQPDDPR